MTDSDTTSMHVQMTGRNGVQFEIVQFSTLAKRPSSLLLSLQWHCQVPQVFLCQKQHSLHSLPSRRLEELSHQPTTGHFSNCQC